VTDPTGLPVTIAIPVFATPAGLMQACFSSIAEAMNPADQVFVVVDGPQPHPLEDVISHASTFGFHVVRQPERLGMVANWNACLHLGSHDLVHLMHADDAVAREFYMAVREAMSSNEVVAVAAGRMPEFLRTTGQRSPLVRSAPSAPMSGQQAAAYLLSHDKPATGSFVMRRSALGTPARGFDARFPYCPDEELFIWLAANGGLALVDRRLYLESRHGGQARYSTWHQSDFADVYYAARLEGARAVGPDAGAVARQQTSRQLLSVGRFLCNDGDRRAARAVARSIAGHDRGAMLDWKFWALIAMSTAVRPGGPPPSAAVAASVPRSRSDP
jgi:hypothetical protein